MNTIWNIFAIVGMLVSVVILIITIAMICFWTNFDIGKKRFNFKFYLFGLIFLIAICLTGCSAPPSKQQLTPEVSQGQPPIPIINSSQVDSKLIDAPVQTDEQIMYRQTVQHYTAMLPVIPKQVIPVPYTNGWGCLVLCVDDLRNPLNYEACGTNINGVFYPDGGACKMQGYYETPTNIFPNPAVKQQYFRFMYWPTGTH